MILATLTLLAAPLAGPQDAELASRLAAAGQDTAALWDVRLWLEEAGRGDDARDVLARILELDPEHEPTRQALAHHRYDGRWFETYTELSRYRRAEERRMLEEHGQVRWQGGWVPEGDLVWLKLGWERQADGTWADPRVLARKAEDRRLMEAGYQQQDLTWIAPEEFDQWRAGLYKCGDEWLSPEDADRYHAELGKWWRVPGEHFVAYTTLARTTQGPEWAVWWADHTWDDLVRILGVVPEEPPVVVVLRDLAQYNTFAAGDPARGLSATEIDGNSSIHYAYFAESWFADRGQGREYMGSGVGWWDREDASLAPFGQHSIRHAAAHSFIEAIDPSHAAVGELRAGTLGQTAPFWAEKRVPRWLRYGAAAYVERYFVDPEAGDGGDPRWARRWALENLQARGGLRDLEAVFAMNLDVDDADSSTQLILEAGLVVAFVLDGGDAGVARAHAALRAALAAGDDTAGPAEDLRRALLAAEPRLRAFGS